MQEDNLVTAPFSYKKTNKTIFRNFCPSAFSAHCRRRLPKAEVARTILEKFGIGINDAENGVFLPTEKGVADAAYHPSLHTKDYYDTVNSMLEKATSREDAIEILQAIAEELQNGTFMK